MERARRPSEVAAKATLGVGKTDVGHVSDDQCVRADDVRVTVERGKETNDEATEWHLVMAGSREIFRNVKFLLSSKDGSQLFAQRPDASGRWTVYIPHHIRGLVVTVLED